MKGRPVPHYTRDYSSDFRVRTCVLHVCTCIPSNKRQDARVMMIVMMTIMMMIIIIKE